MSLMGRNLLNVELDHIRKMWGIPKGVTLLIWDSSIHPIGLAHSYCERQCRLANDNEAKP